MADHNTYNGSAASGMAEIRATSADLIESGIWIDSHVSNAIDFTIGDHPFARRQPVEISEHFLRLTKRFDKLTAFSGTFVLGMSTVEIDYMSDNVSFTFNSRINPSNKSRYTFYGPSGVEWDAKIIDPSTGKESPVPTANVADRQAVRALRTVNKLMDLQLPEHRLATAWFLLANNPEWPASPVVSIQSAS